MRYKKIKDYPYSITDTGKVFSGHRNKFLKPCIKGGYYSVILQNKSKRRQVYVHVLVAEAFLNNPKKKTQVNHIDGDKLNNALSNLEYVTPLENTRHAIELGLYNNTGENNGRAKLSSRHVKAIKVLKGVLPGREIASLFGVGKTAVFDIWRGHSWKGENNE